MDIFEIEAAHSSGIYTKHPIALIRGEGARLWDSTGREYIDCMAGHGVANLGHAHPAVAAAIAAQAQRLITCHEAFYNDQRTAAMQLLASLRPGLERVFLCNSGTEALDAAVNDDTAAVVLEVVQGEGGVHVADGAFLKAAQEICRQRGALLVIDEGQTGLGRPGKMLAIEHFALTPDMLCLAKSVAGGLPMGVVLIGRAVTNFAPGTHGSTFGGNPLACAAAAAALQAILDEGLPGQAAEKGAYLMERLRAIPSPLVREVRGLGLMIGIELKRKVAPYLESMLEQGVIALPAGLTVIRLLPPLVITYPQLDRVLEILHAVLTQPLPGADEA